jgi:hypothetical protein
MISDDTGTMKVYPAVWVDYSGPFTTIVAIVIDGCFAIPRWVPSVALKVSACR